MLIVNADDWGGEGFKTDAIRAAYAAGAITGASAMVYMEDSERAASLPGRPPLGLHLNLTQPFASARTPARVRDRQAYVISRLTAPAHRPWRYTPRLRHLLREVIADQVERFRALYGADPDHIDGHEHAHLCLDVLLALPPGTKVRGPCLRPPAGRPAPLAWLRALSRGALIGSRLRAPRLVYDLDTLAPELGGVGLAEVLALSERHAVEVLCHPGEAADDSVLYSQRWREAVAAARVGSYADL